MWILAWLYACSNVYEPQNPTLDESKVGESTKTGLEYTDSKISETDTSTDTNMTDTQTATDSDKETSPAAVYLLAGQSNMAGLSQHTGLPPHLRVSQEDVDIWWSSMPLWRGLSPSSPHSSGYGIYTGPEVSFGRRMADSDPDRRVYLIKHAVSGTDLHTFWNPGDSATDSLTTGEGYSVFRETFTAGLRALSDQGVDYEISGVLWMQGESDASAMGSALDYEANLNHFIARLRQDTGVTDLPVVVGLIACEESMCPWRDVVRDAQQAVAEGDESVEAIETADLGRNHDDPWHYTGQGMRVLGMRFADAILGLPQSDVPQPAITLNGNWSHDYTGNFTVGWAFDVANTITVTDVGKFDIGADGLSQDSDIGIWRDETFEMVFMGQIPGQGSGPTSLLGGFRSSGTTEFQLSPGRYVIGVQAFTDSPDEYVHNAGYTTNEEVEYVEYRHQPGSVLGFPATAGIMGTTGAWFGPTFWYVTQ